MVLLLISLPDTLVAASEVGNAKTVVGMRKYAVSPITSVAVRVIVASLRVVPHKASRLSIEPPVASAMVSSKPDSLSSWLTTPTTVTRSTILCAVRDVVPSSTYRRRVLLSRYRVRMTFPPLFENNDAWRPVVLWNGVLKVSRSVSIASVVPKSPTWYRVHLTSPSSSKTRRPM